MALGFKTTDMNGNRISFGKATDRYFGKFRSGITLYIGFIVAGFTEKKQALHDIMAGYLVVNKTPIRTAYIGVPLSILNPFSSCLVRVR